MEESDRPIQCNGDLTVHDMSAIKEVLQFLGVHARLKFNTPLASRSRYEVPHCVVVPRRWLWVVRLRRALPPAVFWPAVTAGACSTEARDAVLSALALGGVPALLELLPALPRAQGGAHAEPEEAPP